MAHVEMERQISFFSFGFARVTSVHNMEKLDCLLLCANWFSLLLEALNQRFLYFRREAHELYIIYIVVCDK